MAIFNKQNKPRILAPIFSSVATGLQKIWTMAPTRDKKELPDLAHKNPRLDPINIIAKSIASTEILIYDKRDLRVNKDNAKPIEDHELYDLFEYPMRRYPEIDRYSIFYLTAALIELTGEFGWLKIRDQSGKILEIDPIPAAWVMNTPTYNNPYFMIYPYGVTSSKAFRVPTEDFVWFKRPNLVDPYGRGRGSAESIIDEVESDEYFAKMQKNLAYNDATPPLVISAEGITKEQAEAFKESWMQKLGGWTHRREPAVVPKSIEVTKLGMTPDEMDFIESRKFLRDESLWHYQIPPEIYSVIENSNRSTINSSYYLYHKNVLDDKYRFIERVINRQLIQSDYDENLCVRFKPIIPEDEEHKLAVMNAGISQGTVLVDEWRTAFNMQPLPNGKGQVLLRTFSTFEIPMRGAATPPPEKPAENPQTRPVENPDEEVVLPETEEDKIIHIVIEKDEERDARFDAVWKAFDARARSHEKEFIEAVKKFSATQKKKVVDALNSKKVTDALRTGNAYETEINAVLDGIFGPSTDKALKSALAPAWIATMKSGREQAHEVMGKSVKDIDTSFDLFNSYVNEWIENFGLVKAQGINLTTNETLKRNLIAQISDAKENGETLRDIKNRLMETCDGVYDDMDASRAMKIARTESCSAQNFGSYVTGKSEGMTTKTWISTRDDRTRHDHDDVNGQTVGIDDKFVVGGSELDYPGDAACNDAGEIVNCRCTSIFNYE